VNSCPSNQNGRIISDAEENSPIDVQAGSRTGARLSLRAADAGGAFGGAFAILGRLRVWRSAQASTTAKTMNAAMIAVTTTTVVSGIVCSSTRRRFKLKRSTFGLVIEQKFALPRKNGDAGGCDIDVDQTDQAANACRTFKFINWISIASSASAPFDIGHFSVSV
jgi:hypothetical protein